MKKLIIPAIMLTAAPALAAIDCAVLPTCDSLGYTDTLSTCPKDYLVCPFDNTMGKCLLESTPGQIGYFAKDPGKGWILCNGYFQHKDVYPDLYAAIGTTFGGGGSTFGIPDYRGLFLRVYGGNSGTITVQQAEGLPNITGRIPAYAPGYWQNYTSGAFYADSGGSSGGPGGTNGEYYIGFDASKYNSIYGASSHVTPVNQAVYAYMYAGRTDTSKASSYSPGTGCAKGSYLYSDGSCSSSYDSSKTLLGIAYSSAGTSSGYVSLGNVIFGGISTASTYEQAAAACKAKGASVESNSYYTSTVPTSVPTTQSVVRSVQAGQYYWGGSTKYYCSSATSCSSTTAGNSAYYYCYKSFYFQTY